MIQHPASRLLAIVQARRCILLEELLTHFPELTWTQVFSLVDSLSRHELIRLRRRGFEYELQASS